MRFLPLGVGDAFSAIYYSSCLVIEAEGQRLLVDCPHPIRKMMRESGAGLDVGDIDAVVLTHLHADHSSGLEGFGYFAHFALRRRARLYALPQVIADLWQGHLSAGMKQLLRALDEPPHPMHLDDYFDVTPLDERGETSVGPFSIGCRRTVHHIATAALRLSAGGRTLGYSADTAFDRSLISWLEPSDLVIHETNLGTHTPYERLAELPAELRAKMRLIHYTDSFDRASSVIEPLVEGRWYEV